MAKRNKAMRASPVSHVGMTDRGKWQREWLVRMPLDELVVIEARKMTKRKNKGITDSNAFVFNQSK
jgi:hypothetical protein